MSYDLSIWLSDHAVSTQEAEDVYSRMCEGGDGDSVSTDHRVARFIKEISAVYPQLRDCSDEQLGMTPWTGDFDVLPGGTIITIGWSQCKKVVPWVVKAALENGLTCYDPQSENVHLPPQFGIANSTLIVKDLDDLGVTPEVITEWLNEKTRQSESTDPGQGQ